MSHNFNIIRYRETMKNNRNCYLIQTTNYPYSNASSFLLFENGNGLKIKFPIKTRNSFRPWIQMNGWFRFWGDFYNNKFMGKGEYILS